MNTGFVESLGISHFLPLLAFKSAPVLKQDKEVHLPIVLVSLAARFAPYVALENGHKRVHALKFQSVVVPNGLIANLYGPVEGARHDAGMLKDSGLLQTLEREAYNPRGDVLCLYGDPAYPLRPHLMAPYRIGEVPVFTADMEAFNSAMSSARASVEWLFGDISNSFKFLDFKKNLKLGLSAVGKQYIVSALFRNILTCLYGNTTSTHFQLDPPTVQDYLA